MTPRTCTILAVMALACRTDPPDRLEVPTPVASPGPADTDAVAEDGPVGDGRSLVLISLDGFRWDYLSPAHTPNLMRIGEGVRAESLQPPFPSYTFPSHYTIVTGLHPEHHGIVSNVFYDPERRDQFKLGAPEDMTDGSWWGGEPLWNTAERQGMPAATLFWPGSEAAIGGRRPSDWMPYDSGLSHRKRVDTVLGWLGREPAERPGFITLYFSSVDSAGHGHGPEAPEVLEAVRSVDASIGQLLEGIEARGLSEQVDLVVVSDHGMAPKDPDKVVFLDDAEVSLSGVHVVEYSPLLQARIPDAARAAEVAQGLDALPHMQCHLQGRTPESWHYRDHRAIGDVVCLADHGWQLTQRAYFDSNPSRFVGGTHGWDPEWKEMHGIFLASGPRFRKDQQLGTVRAVDLYGVMAAVLGLEPAEHDGDPSVIPLMVEPSR